jgi:predicted RNA-binding Zn ribbon-like protein
METPDGGLMLRVTWEWLGSEAALDLANTVAVADGIPHDLLAPAGEYERWAAAAARSPALAPDEAAAIAAARRPVLELRDRIRQALAATAAGEAAPRRAAVELNRRSRTSPTWVELDADGTLRQQAQGSAVDRLLAAYARSAITIAAEGPARLRVCPAPSCGMFYRPGRPQQRWCSPQCGNRARFARHYQARRR